MRMSGATSMAQGQFTRWYNSLAMRRISACSGWSASK
jgi:hypothetical protein